MMLKNGKIMSIILIIMLLFAGCSMSKEQNTAMENTSGSNEEQKTTETNSQQEGVTIRFLAANHSWFDAIKPLLPEFTKETGIKIEVESFTEGQLSNKIAVESTAGLDTLDVFMLRPQGEGMLMATNGWLESLDDFVATDESYNIDDFFPTALDALTFNGKLLGIPIISERTIMYYRKDLFEQYGLKVPTTFEELEAVAAKLTIPEEELYGFVARGQLSASTVIFSNFLSSYGGTLSPVDGQSELNTPEAIAAFDFYGSMLRNYAPPGVLNMNWPEASAVFSQGNVAMYIDADSVYKGLIDPTKSKVAEQVGFAVFPAGPEGAQPWNMCAWGLGISPNSKHKEAAWKFVNWITNEEHTKTVQKQGVTSARTSAWNDEEVVSAMPAELVDVITQTFEIGTSKVLPKVIKVQEARDIVGSVVTLAIEGGDVEAEANKADEDYQTLIDKEFVD